MPHKRALMAVLTIALLGAFLIQAAPADAQGSWTCTWNFANSNGGWEQRDYSYPSWGSVYTAGQGWYNANTSSNSIRRQFTDSTTLTYFEAQYNGGQDDSALNVNTLANGTGTNLINLHRPIGQALIWTGSVSVPSGNWAMASILGFVKSTITRITLSGTGNHPFGAGNCDPNPAEYSSVPADGGTVTIGTGPVGEQLVNDNAMQISNLGDLVLLNDFSISGDATSDFEMITDNPLGVSGGTSASVVIACTPSTYGERTATLTVETNDTDESTNTYTLSCTGEAEAGESYLGTCLAMGQAATFATGWTTFGGAGNPPETQRGMMLPPGSEATYSLSLQPTWQYAMTVKFHSETPQADHTFKVKLGAHVGFDVPLVKDTASHTYEIPGGNYPPDQYGGYTLRLSKASGGTDPGLVVDYICVTQRKIAGAAPGQGGGGNGIGATCDVCAYEPEGREIDVFGFGITVPDLSAIINWLFCGLRAVWECEILPALNGIWSMVTDTVKFLSSFRGLFDGIVTLVSDATVGNLGALGTFGGAHMGNLGGMVGNAFYTSGLADAQNQIVGGVNNVAPSVANALGSFGGSSGAATAPDPTASGDPLGGPLHAIITAFGYLFTMVPQFIASMIDGLNTGAYVPVSGSITCSAPVGLLYYPCLGFYVADNTLFKGPAQYLIPILMAVLAWDTLTWAIAKFKEAFSK